VTDITTRDVRSHVYATLYAHFYSVFCHAGYQDADVRVDTVPGKDAEFKITVQLPGYMTGAKYEYTVRISGGKAPMHPTKVSTRGQP
jgi:hypothetical protein